MEDNIRKVIALACLKHADTGESSKDIEARRIMQALKDNGFHITPIKNLVECRQCNEQVEMVSTGEICPKCYC